MQKTQKGITLVALVITIIILLILAGISIASLTQTGLFGKAKDAKQKSENAQVEENAILENYMAQIDEITGEKKTNKAYNVGDEVTIGTESFYVIEASDANTETVKLLAKYNLNKAGTEQAPDANYRDTACAFSAAGGFSVDEDLNENATVLADKTSAVYKANAYAKTCRATKGRLLTYTEANNLKASYGDMIWGKANNQGNGNYLCYWLGSAISTSGVWDVYGGSAFFHSDGFSYSGYYGVRPVIEISKSLIQ